MDRMRKNLVFFEVSRLYRNPRGSVQSNLRIESTPNREGTLGEGEVEPVPERIKPRAGKRRLEIPTLMVALAIYGGFLVLTGSFRDLPLLIAAPLGSVLLA